MMQSFMRAPRELEGTASALKEYVVIQVQNKQTGDSVQLQACYQQVLCSRYIRAAMRFKRLRQDRCIGFVSVSVTNENSWCPEEALHFLETGDIRPSVYSRQRDLLLLLQFADYVGVDALVDGCLQCLMTLHLQNSQRPALWSTITFFQQVDIPDTISKSVFWPACCNLAQSQAVEALRDLEQVMGSVEGCRRIMTLSHTTFLYICRSCSTQVAYESTVAAAITLWCIAHPEASHEQLYELACTVCLLGLPRMYMATVLTQLPWWRQVMREGALLQAMELSTTISPPGGGNGGSNQDCSSSSSSSSKLSDGSSRKSRRTLDSLLQHMESSERSMYRLLLRSPRESSQSRRLQLTATLTEQQLKQAYQHRTCSGSSSEGSATNCCSSSGVCGVCEHGGWLCATSWQAFAGVHWQLMYQFVRAGSQERRNSHWQLAAGVRFSVLGVPQLSAVSLKLPTLHLEHVFAVAPGPRLTRLQLELRGFDPADATHLLPAGLVLACLEVLPVGLSGADWSQHNMNHISRYLDDTECVPLAVTISNFE